MKYQVKSIALTFIFILFAGLTYGQLKIQVSNMKEAKGEVVVAVFDSDTTFLMESVICGLGYPVKSTTPMTIELESLPFGTYALSLYHDQNGNDELDTNLLGIPKEPYGFSNNVRGNLGPPTFAEVKFDYEANGQLIEIELK